ncbi:MAG: cupin domain-containing protein [Acidimicrobiia bacterium]
MAVDHQPGKETTVHRITIGPGGSSGWHRHHDGGVFLVLSGTLTNYGLDGPACEPVEVKAGEAVFVPPHPHHAHSGIEPGQRAAGADLRLLQRAAGRAQPARRRSTGGVPG